MSSQTYRSTRSTGAEAFSFEETVLKGLASDGGLFIPSVIPKVDSQIIESWSNLSFQDLAFQIMRLYVKESEIPDEDLKKLIHNSYSTFRHEDVTPLNTIDEGNGLYLLELFHGPTYAFKDVALQFVGNLFEYFLQRKNQGKSDADRDVLTVVGATSGDTGSAAIYGLRGKKDVSVFILYPTGRISPIQEAQMASVLDPNVHTLSVKGTFDDCQDIVKQIFGDAEFNKDHHVGAVNSINWARILAQQTYYFYSYFQLLKKVGSDKKIRFVVPSGNFGDILAGYYAKEVGLPADKLIIATNENDILDRFLKSSKYEKGGDVKATLSPAMDILISSNFERLLWYLVRDNITKSDEKAGETINNWFAELKQTGSFTVQEEVISAAKKDFDSERVDNADTIKTIKDVYTSNTTKYVLDPHSAVGVTASYRNIAQDKAQKVENVKYISLSTAHPAKFAEAVNQSLSSIEGYSFEKEVLPEELKQLSTKELKIKLIDEANVEVVKAAIIEELQKEGK
ncbi:threonine synthase [Wickerhamomyces ciferrii]|uniref:Threonine synthase n=1 Tax=Wickerhamomyces ciferrii (strain ATCC 14091 / BCRC 22168 / CBS 111 / JCM 3599 / NBRC 0793 / NRRL Y-1031 F-60-10) TaxID=1206466 RepID=K0KNQ6_WICCF|nr:threonine synthase [Wickerhamomyces ciferrii]CCH46905.1 threonine synthase [Wickerhamomyces ciferrii]